MASFHSGPGQHAVTISSGSSVRSVIDISSSSDSDEVTSRPTPRVAQRRRTPPSSSVRSKATGGHEAATSPPRRAGRRRRPSSPPFSSVRSKVTGGVEAATSPPRRAARRRRPSSPASSGGSSARSAGDEGTSRRRYNKWTDEDELEVIDAMGNLSKGNGGVIPRASHIFKELLANPAFSRDSLHVKELSSKMYCLKRKFAMSAHRAAANGGKLRRKSRYRDKRLYEMSHEHDLWPEVAADDGAAYLEARGITPQPRRR